MTDSPISPALDAGPLSDAHYELLRRCAAAGRPVRKAARVARGSAVSILIVAIAGLPLLAFAPSLGGLAAVVVIGVIGVRELVGARRMRRGDPGAATMLATNQFVFLALIIVYCISRIVVLARAGTAGVLGAEAQAQIHDLEAANLGIGTGLAGLAQALTYMFYALVIAVSAALQGGLALYYLSRRRHLEALRQSVPPWVQRVLTAVDA